MNRMERAALAHAQEQQRYQRSAQASRDRAADMARRAEIDRKLGHSPKCGILVCHPECRKGK